MSGLPNNDIVKKAGVIRMPRPGDHVERYLAVEVSYVSHFEFRRTIIIEVFDDQDVMSVWAKAAFPNNQESVQRDADGITGYNDGEKRVELEDCETIGTVYDECVLIKYLPIMRDIGDR